MSKEGLITKTLFWDKSQNPFAMKNLLFILAFFATFFHPAMTSAQVIDLGGTTRAVVVGISDYQDDKIPDLRFADRDALAFAEFLRSKTGGGLTEDQLKLLTNEKATYPQIYMALDWLMETTKEGDLAIIYFSGHGDAEVKMITKPGYLLTYETPAQIPSTASIHLTLLENIIATLSLANKARVLVVTDACRSGILAGREGGAKMANTELAAMAEKAVKIMSCQPEEQSYEGEQWGGGRGAFSYFLVNGLYGLADADASQQVTLTEIGRYLEDNVSREVSPSSQMPKVMGNPKETLAAVFPDELATIKESLDPLKVNFKSIEQRGLEDETLARVDSATREMYRQFKEAVAAKQFFEPKNTSADTFYNQLRQVAALQPLHNTMKRNYAAALMDDAQAAMNGWLRSDPREVESWASNRQFDYLQFPRQLEKAAEILGKEHYLYKDLKAKEYFFKIRTLVTENFGQGGTWDSVKLEQLLHFVQEGLRYDDKAPYLYVKMGYYYGYQLNYEVEQEWLKKAIDLAPSWTQAYCWLSLSYWDNKEYNLAYKTTLDAYLLDTSYLRAIDGLGNYFMIDHQFEKYKKIAEKKAQVIESKILFRENDFKSYCGYYYWWGGFPAKAESYLKSFLKQDFDSSFFYAPYYTAPNWSYNFIGWANYVQNDTLEAERYWLIGDSINGSSMAMAKLGLSLIAFKRRDFKLVNEYFSEVIKTPYFKNPDWFTLDWLHLIGVYGRLEEAMFLFSKSIEHYPTHAPLHYHLARIYLEQKNDYEKGVPLLERAVQLDSTHAHAHYHLAAAYAHLGKKEAALDYLEKALALGYDDPEGIGQDARWEGLRSSKRYKALVARYSSNPSND